MLRRILLAGLIFPTLTAAGTPEKSPESDVQAPSILREPGLSSKYWFEEPEGPSIHEEATGRYAPSSTPLVPIVPKEEKEDMNDLLPPGVSGDPGPFGLELWID